MSRGSLLGGYRLLEPLGSGALTRTFAAQSSADGSAAVAKVLHPELAEDADLVARYSTAANRLTTLVHPNIAQVLRVGSGKSGVDSAPFLIVERCSGKPLRSSLGHGALPLHVACQIGVQICRALLAAHACGVVHRDLTPENVMLSWRETGQPRVKVTDFGLSWAAFEGHPSHEAVRWGSRTPRYASPEVLVGLPADERADVYSAAAILFEALAGAPLIDTRDEVVALQRALNGEHTPLSKHDPSLPVPLVEQIERALAVEPDQRLPSVRDLLQALAPHAGESGSRTTLGRNTSRERHGSGHESVAKLTGEPVRAVELSDRVAHRVAPEELAALRLLLEPVFPKSPRTPRIALNLDSLDLESFQKPPSLPPTSEALPPRSETPAANPEAAPPGSQARGSVEPPALGGKHLDWLALTAGFGLGAALLLLAL